MEICLHEIVDGEVVLAIVKPGAPADHLLELDHRVDRAHQNNVADIASINASRTEPDPEGGDASHTGGPTPFPDHLQQSPPGGSFSMHIATVVLSLSSLVGVLTRNRRNHPNTYVTANNPATWALFVGHAKP